MVTNFLLGLVVMLLVDSIILILPDQERWPI